MSNIMVMRGTLLIASSFFFGLWQNNTDASLFLAGLMGFAWVVWGVTK